LLEDHYSVADAVVFGGLLISLLRHSDRVVSASLAQLVNVIAPIMTRAGGPAWQQTTYYPFAQASALATGSVLQVATESPTCETAAYGPVPLVDAVATHNESTGLITVFAVNRALRDSVSLSLPTTAFGAVRLVEATVLSYEDPYRKARSDTARELAPRPNPMTEWDGTRLSVVLPPVSWNVIQLAVDRST
jgi:alpha-N-arabinofuranosidase